MLDADHRLLCELAQTLLWLLSSDGPHTDALNVLDDLVEATLAHFEREEQLLLRADYPELVEHTESHNRLLRAILHFREDVRHQRYRSEVAARFIQAWVIEHVRHEDVRYADYVGGRASKFGTAD